VILTAITQAQAAGARLAQACRIAGISARSIERWRRDPDGDDRRQGPQRRPRNALSSTEETLILSVLTSSRFAHVSPRQLVPKLADEGLYLASESTLYRLARKHGLRPKRSTATRTHVTRSTTVHRATGPNQVWSWDITWLPALVRGRYFYLYMVMDVWSRRIVGWTLGQRESPDTAAQMIMRICRRQRRPARVDPALRQRHGDAWQHDAHDPAMARRHPVVQSPARIRRQPLLRSAVSDPEAHARVPSNAVRQLRECYPMGHAVRWLVQRRAPPQRHSVRDAERATFR
jgi:transposase InsO family protein